MTGQQRGGGESAVMLSYKALRSRLNNLDSRYHVLFSEESAPLIESLVTDLVASDERCKSVRDDTATKGFDANAAVRELQLMRQENPRLLKENTELHKRVLSNSQAQEDSRWQWDERLEAAACCLSHARAVHQQSELRATELQSTVEQMRGRVGELQRLCAAHAGQQGGRRPPSLIMESGAGSCVPSSGSTSAGPMGPGAMTCISSFLGTTDEMFSKLCVSRKQRATQMGKLLAVKVSARAAREEAKRVAAYMDEDEVKGRDSVDNEALRVEESQLKSQEGFLESACRSLQKKEEKLNEEHSASKRLVRLLRQDTWRLQSEIKGFRSVASTQEAAEGASASKRRNSAVNFTVERRQLEAEVVNLEDQSKDLGAKLDRTEMEATAEDKRHSQELGHLRGSLHDEIRNRPTEQLQFLEGELELVSSVHAQRRASCAGLSARLASTRTHCDAQKTLLSTRHEEVAASQRAHKMGEQEVQSLDSQLHDLEARTVTARGEVNSMRSCLEEASERHCSVARELQLVRAEAEELKRQCEREETERANITKEVEQARASALDNDIKLAELRHEGESLHTESERLQSSLRQLEERLGAQQRGHRELSAGVDKAIQDRQRGHAARQAETSEEFRVEHRVHMVQEDVKRAVGACQRASELRREEAQQATRNCAAALVLTSEVSRSGQSARQDALGRIGGFDPNLVSMHGKVVYQRQEHPMLQANLRALQAQAFVAAHAASASAAGVEITSRGATSEQHVGGVQRAEEQFDADWCHMQKASVNTTSSESLVEALQEKRVRCRHELADAEDTQVRFKQVMNEEASQLHATESAYACSQRKLREIGAGSMQAETGLEELQARQRQLTGFLHGYESTHEQLAQQVREASDAVRSQKALHEAATQLPMAGQELQIEALVVEGQHLKTTLSTMESGHADLQQVASERGRELERLRLQMSELQSTRVDLQWALDKLRNTEDSQHGEIAAQAKDIECASRQVEALEMEVRMAQSEVEARRRDASMGLEDLLLMTRENQLLHDELAQMKNQDEALAARHHGHGWSGLPRAQQALSGTEVECQNILRVYRQAIEERRRNETGIAELADQEERCMNEVGSMQARRSQLLDNEEQGCRRLLRGSAELSALRQQLSGACRALELRELACGEAEASRVRTVQVVAKHQADASQTLLQRSAMSSEVEALRLEVASAQQEFTVLQAKAALHSRERQEAAAMQAHLQQQVADQRLRQQQLAAESSSIRRALPSLPMSRSGGDANLLGGSASAAAELTRRLEQQDALIQEMEAERKGLDAHVQLLREENASSAALRACDL